MKTLFIHLFLSLLPLTTKGSCLFSANEFYCNHTDSADLLKSFYKHCYKVKGISPRFSITIEDSTFHKIGYFPNLPLSTQISTTSRLTVKNSSVEWIDGNAFEELTNLEYLDLSWNKLKNILFVKTIPGSVNVLVLNNNNVTYLDDVFGRLQGLTHIDLSYNNIGIIDFKNVYWVPRLNFSYNRITTLIPTEKLLMVSHLDLSYNKLVTFSELELNGVCCYLDISHNELTTVVLNQNHKTFLGLAANNIRQLSVGSSIEILDLSLSNTSLSFKNIHVLPTQLIMRNNTLGALQISTLDIFKNGNFLSNNIKIDLSSSAVSDISPYYFKDITSTKLLNLSDNNIVLLRNKVFFGTKLDTLDLSNSNVEQIQESAFKSMSARSISLKGNRLEVFNNIIMEEVFELDLSFNKFKVITNHSFIKCPSLTFLNLEHCSIERIEPDGFVGLNNLQDLLLAHNKLFILEENSFNNLLVRQLSLEGNKIDTIRSKAFNNLPNLKTLNLSRVAVCNLESYAFNNLMKVEILDLSYNNIVMIPPSLFVDMGNLRTVYLEGNNITTLNTFSNRLRLNTLTLTYTGILKSGQILNANIKNLHFIDSKVDIMKNDSLAGLYNLMELHLNNTYVSLETGTLNDLFNLKYLDSQSLFRHAEVIRQDTFKDLMSLEYLDLSNLSLQRLETKAFTGLTSLEVLLLNGNNLSELHRDIFYGLNSLKVLNLSNCNIYFYDDKVFSELQTLEILHLEYNSLPGVTSEILHSLNNLLELHLDHNSIFSLDIKSFSSLTKLVSLYLQNNKLNEFPTGSFQYLTALEVLNLSNNQIELLKTGALSNLRSLKLLDLSDNKLVNLEYVDIFFSLKQLEIVYFDGNHLKDFDFRRFLINLRKVKYVGISYNKWKCDTLSYIIENLSNKSIDYRPGKPMYDDDNIDGIGCVDICKFVYCSHENENAYPNLQ